MALKAEAANKLLSSKDNYKYLTKRDVTDPTVCPYDGEFPDSSCINGTCEKCGVKDIKHCFQPYMEAYKRKEIQYHRWETITIKGKDDKMKKCVSCVSKSATFEEFVEDFSKDAEPIATYQVTIHPMMAYYFVETQEDNGEIKTLRKHAVIGISNERKHDADSVEGAGCN